MNRVCVYMIRSSCDGSVAAATTKIPMWNAFRGLMLSCSWRHTTQCPLLSLRLCRYNCACLPVMCCACLLEMILKWPALPCALPVAERALSLPSDFEAKVSMKMFHWLQHSVVGPQGKANSSIRLQDSNFWH